MRKIWKILAVLATMVVLLSALFLTASAENENGDTTDPSTGTEQSGEGSEQPSTSDTSGSTDTDTSATTESTDIGGEQPSASTNSQPTETIVTTSTTQSTTTSTAPTQTTRPRPTATTTTTTTITTTETTTETTDAVIIPTSTQHPIFGSPSLEQGNKPAKNPSDPDHEEPLPIGKWALYTILSLLIMVGGGVAIYLITNTLQK